MSGYDQFFKKAQSVRGRGPSQTTSQEMESHWADFESERRLNEFRTRKGKGLRPSREKSSASQLSHKNTSSSNRTKAKPKRRAIPYVSISILSALTGFATFGPVTFHDAVQFWNSWEVRAFSMAGAASENEKPETKPEAGKNLSNQEEGAAKTSQTKSEKGSAESHSTKAWTAEEIALFKNLEQRKLQLDSREAELNKMEEELQKQKVELEAKLKSLEDTRRKIAGQLESRVQTDQEKLDKLVSFYSNMKPQQAANVFKDLNEDLVVEVLGKMKQKNAADIMNLLPPDKAQRLSEKYAGYKRAAN